MMPRYMVLKLTLLLIGISLLSSPSVWANQIAKRMKARIPAIAQLKAKGAVGENNKGFLEFKINKPTQEEADLIAAENKDRSKVYGAIAKQQGTTVENVGKRRAAQIEKKASPGEWVQNAEGKWYRKKK